jgi:hypothetical protein
MVNVPSAFVPYVKQASSGTGLPYGLVAAQANDESGFKANAVSSAGAEGWLQFLPSTYNAYAAQSGVPQNTEFNVADETKVYVTYMNSLLKQEGGSVFKALEAYNAGPGNLPAGAGYANSIMSAAGVSQSAQAGGGSNASTTSDISTAGLIPGIPGIPGVNTIISDVGGAILKAFGVSSLKDMFQRLGLILFGAVLIYVGIRILSEGNKDGGNKGSNNSSQQGGGNRDSEQSSGRRQQTVQAREAPKEIETPSGSTGASSGTIQDLDVGPAMEAAEVA